MTHHRLRTLLCFAALLAGPVHAEVSETIEYIYYDAKVVPGTSVAAALNDVSPIRRNGRVFHGYTKWQIKWNFWWREQPGRSCQLTKVKTSVAGTITLPRISGASPAQRREFDRYVAALKEHELGHQAIGREAALEVDREILALSAMKDCKALERTANETGSRIVEKFKERELRYDLNTDHGRTQGAYLIN